MKFIKIIALGTMIVALSASAALLSNSSPDKEKKLSLLEFGYEQISEQVQEQVEEQAREQEALAILKKTNAALLSNSSLTKDKEVPFLEFGYEQISEQVQDQVEEQAKERVQRSESLAIFQKTTFSLLKEEGFVPAVTSREVQPGLVLTTYTKE